MQIIETIARKLGVKNWQVEAAVKLIDEGNTIPFIARYRKEATGTLTDEQLRELGESLTYLRSLEERKSKVMESIREQGKLTKELEAAIEAAQTLVEVEDLYLPYRPKRRTRAGIAKEKGLQGLADYILAQKKGSDVKAEAAKYVDEAKDVKDAQEAIAGAMDIIAEQISDEARFRAWIREKTLAKGTLVTSQKALKKAKDGEAEDKTPAKLKERRDVYEMYFEYEEALRKIPGHRVLAVNRGEKENFLSVKIAAPEEDILYYLERQVTRGAKEPDPGTFPYIKAAVRDSYDRLIAPAIERELRNQLTEEAEDGAIRVFASNLEQLLMQQPIAGKVVLGWDPAFRTGCKLAVCDPTGKILYTTVIYPTAPQNRVEEARKVLAGICDKFGVDIISVGLFAAAGTDKAILYRLNPVAIVLMGTITGVGGGMMRDVFLGEVPRIFRRSNWYALCAIAGSCAYYLCAVGIGIDKAWAAIISVLITLVLRRISLRYNLYSPANVDLEPTVRQTARSVAEAAREVTTNEMKHAREQHEQRKNRRRIHYGR